METETRTAPELLILRNNMGATLRVTPDELQAIVQAAYDQRGILAAPSYATEATRVVVDDQQPRATFVLESGR